PDQNDPEIDQRTTSDFNFRLKLVMADRKTKGLAVDFGPQDGVVSIRPTVDGNEATVKSCYVDQSAIVKKGTGAVVNPMRTVKESMTVNLVREGDAWKIRRLAVDRKPGTRVLAD